MWIQHPASLGHEVTRYSFVQRCAHDFVHVEFARWLVIRFVRSKIVMSKHKPLAPIKPRI